MCDVIVTDDVMLTSLLQKTIMCDVIGTDDVMLTSLLQMTSY
jgi:hypothetical protein